MSFASMSIFTTTTLYVAGPPRHSPVERQAFAPPSAGWFLSIAAFTTHQCAYFTGLGVLGAEHVASNVSIWNELAFGRGHNFGVDVG